MSAFGRKRRTDMDKFDVKENKIHVNCVEQQSPVKTQRT